MNMENTMQRMMKNLKQNAALPLSLLAALTMAGCNETGTSSLGSSEDEHDHAENDHPGRLVIACLLYTSPSPRDRG